MLKAIPFLSGFVLSGTLLLSVALGGLWTLLTPLVAFFGLPLVDRLVGHDLEDTAEEGAAGFWFDAVVRLWAPVQVGTLLVVVSSVSTGAWTAPEILGLLLSASVMTAGGAINAAHELMHRKSSLDRALAEILMMTASYTHFCIEHVHGHHRHVATPLDPATARMGESLYAFLPRTLAGGLKSAIRIETGRNARRHIGWFTWRNRLSRYLVLGVASWAAVGLAFGWRGLAFYLAQCLGGALFLEVINYVEHYGLMREEIAPGKYEKVQPRHSWNANDRVSNWWLFNLQRHADHHANASRPYYNLRAIEEGPQLPFSYPTMILLALVPPVWHALMDPAVRTHVPEAVPAK